MDIILSKLSDLLTGIINVGLDVLLIVIIFVAARLLVDLVSKITGATMKKADRLDNKNQSQRIKTSMTLTHSANRYFIYLIAIILCINVIGLGDEISSGMVVAGIGGLIISLGSQSIVKDMIAGLFLLFERQYYVGDYVKIDGYEGNVTSIALRVTYLDCAGKKVIIPNGEIKDVVNYSRSNNIAIIEVPTPYTCNTRKIISILQNVVDEYYKHHENILTKNKAIVSGIDSFSDKSVNIMIRIETKPLMFWKVQKDILLLIKEEFERQGIELPYEQIKINKTV